jgi:hypothetical protein
MEEYSSLCLATSGNKTKERPGPYLGAEDSQLACSLQLGTIYG